jgi:SHS2 domain-containing protein
MVEARKNWAPRDRDEAYAELDHPADLFLEVRGSDLPTLFANALFALYDQLVELDGFEARCEWTVTVQAPCPADALRALLAEALFRFETEGLVAIGAEVTVQTTATGDVHVVAGLRGDNADRRRHTLLTEVKAVTYHRLAVDAAPGGGWRATVVLDV